MKVLLIEDNTHLVATLKDFLSKAWKVDSTSSGAAGVELATSSTYDVIVLDLNLPDVPGHVVCQNLRKAQVTAPILILTGSSEPLTKINLFKYGADDYVTKPFNASELNARLLALLRRGSLNPEQPYVLAVADLTLDPVKREVKRAGKQISLRRKEFDILEYLIRNQGKVVTRPMIMDNVWEADTDSWNNTVDVHIKYLRDKIDRPFTHKLIQTAYGVGYTITNSV